MKCLRSDVPSDVSVRSAALGLKLAARQRRLPGLRSPLSAGSRHARPRAASTGGKPPSAPGAPQSGARGSAAGSAARTARPAPNCTMLQLLRLKTGEEGPISPPLPPHCATAVPSPALRNKDCFLLGPCRAEGTRPLKAPPLAPSHVQTASSHRDLFRAENAARTSCYARHVTNTGAGNKSFSKKQTKQSYAKHSPSSVYRGQASSRSYSFFLKYICFIQKAEMTSQLQDQESRMFTEHR